MGERDRISFERLADWVEGRLSGEEAAVVEERVARAGEETWAKVEWLRAFARASAETTFASPPDEVRDFLYRSFAARAGETRDREPDRPGFLERIVATLSFDSGLHGAAAGTRTAGAGGEQRQLAFTTEPAEIVLDVMPRPGGRSLDLGGQVFPAGDEGPEGFAVEAFDVKLLRDGEEVGAATTDDLGEFAFEDIPYGAYELLLDTGRFEVLVPRFELSP